MLEHIASMQQEICHYLRVMNVCVRSLPRFAAHMMINIHHMGPSLPADGPLCIHGDPHILTRTLYPFMVYLTCCAKVKSV